MKQSGREFSDDEFRLFAAFLQKVSGISLASSKKYLVSTRINRILEENRIGSLRELVDKLQSPAMNGLRGQIVDAMTTNETYWFRDKYPFDFLRRHIFPELHTNNDGSDIRLWSAACSSGQEPFSLSIIAEEFFRGWSQSRRGVKIMATDVSNKVMSQAKEGIYDRISMSRGIDQAVTQKYFKELNAGESWSVNSVVKNRIDFKVLNLIDNFQSLGKFDVIFCRNVLIYFSPELKVDILKRLHAALRPNGYLCLGSSEGISGLNSYFKMIQCHPGIMYQAV